MSKSYLDSWLELTADVMSVCRIWCFLYRTVGKAFFKIGTGQTGQEPDIHIHKLNQLGRQSHSINNHLICLAPKNELSTSQPRYKHTETRNLSVCVCVDLERQALLTEWAMLSSGYWERRRQILNSCLVEREEARDCAWRHMPHTNKLDHAHVNKLVRAHTHQHLHLPWGRSSCGDCV